MRHRYDDRHIGGPADERFVHLGRGSVRVELRQQGFARRRQHRLVLRIGAERARQLQAADKRSGNHHRVVLRCCGRQTALDQRRQRANACCRSFREIAMLPRHLRDQGRDDAAVLGSGQVRIRQVQIDQGPEGADAARLLRVDALGHRELAVAAGAFERLRQHSFARLEVGIEAAVGQAGLPHDVGDADPGKAVSADVSGGGLDDPVVGHFAAARSGRHDAIVEQYMMIVIFLQAVLELALPMASQPLTIGRGRRLEMRIPHARERVLPLKFCTERPISRSTEAGQPDGGAAVASTPAYVPKSSTPFPTLIVDAPERLALAGSAVRVAPRAGALERHRAAMPART